MPTHTVNFTPEQYNHIYSTSEENKMSERVRELVHMGMALEQTELDEVKKIQHRKHDEWSPDLEEGLDELVNFYIEGHE